MDAGFQLRPGGEAREKSAREWLAFFAFRGAWQAQSSPSPPVAADVRRLHLITLKQG